MMSSNTQLMHTGMSVLLCGCEGVCEGVSKKAGGSK